MRNGAGREGAGQGDGMRNLRMDEIFDTAAGGFETADEFPAKETGMLQIQEQAVSRLKEKIQKGEEISTALWEAILAFEQFPFRTSSGLDFTYTVKLNRSGQKGNELAVSRKEKTITRSSVEKALAKVLEVGRGVLPVEMSSPKQLGTFGASYLYPVFIQFGLVVHVAPMKSRCTGKRRAEKGG